MKGRPGKRFGAELILKSLLMLPMRKMKIMNQMLLVGIVFIASIASAAGPEKSRENAASKATTVQIKDKPMTYLQPTDHYRCEARRRTHRSYL